MLRKIILTEKPILHYEHVLGLMAEEEESELPERLDPNFL